MSSYQVRKAKPSDIDAIIELCRAHAKFEGASYDKTDKAERLSGYLFSSETPVKCLVVETEAKIVGYTTFTQEFSTWDAAYYLHMDCLYLKPEARGKGLGKRIIKRIREEAKNEGYTNVQWQTPVDNDNAIAFYKKIGAVPKEKARFYLKP